MPGKDAQFPNDDPFDIGDDFEEPQAGNRPASGARKATPGEIFSQSFHGSDNAGDFLGLDTEFEMDTGSSGTLRLSGDGSAPFAHDPGHALPEAHVPTVHGQHAAHHEPDPYAAVQTEEEAVQAAAPHRFYEASPESGLDEEYDDESLPQDLYATEDLEAALAETQPQKSRSPILVLAAFVVGLVAVGGFAFGPDLLQYVPGLSGNETANRAAPAPRTASHPKPAVDDAGAASGGETGATEDPTVATAESAAAPLTDGGPSTGSPDPAAGGIESGEPVAALPEGGEARPSTRVPFWEDVVPDTGEPASGSRPAPSSRPSVVPQDGSTQSVDPAVGTDFPNLVGLRWAESNDLDMVWRGEDVPMEAIQSPSPIMMPRVGPVRVHMASGELFDGRLYAMGENRVWIDAEPGRIGLDGERVTRIERLVAVETTTGDQALIVAGNRVKVSVPGGVMFGRVLSVEDESVTLLTDEGGRVTVKHAVVEPVGSPRAFVVSR